MSIEEALRDPEPTTTSVVQLRPYGPRRRTSKPDTAPPTTSGRGTPSPGPAAPETSAAARSRSAPSRGRSIDGPEARERYELACAADDARARRWSGEPLDISRRDGSYPLFSFVGALTAAPHDDLVLRRTIRRIGLLDRTAVFDQDNALHDRIEMILQRLTTSPPSPPGPPRQEMLARLTTVAPSAQPHRREPRSRRPAR